ncbi:MAG: hypothetical protein ACK5N9_09725 [Pirellula sp.]
MMARRQESDRSIPKTMMVTWSFPPVLLGSSQIAAGLARQFSFDEMVIAAENWPGLDRNKWDDEGRSKPEVYFIHKQWPWKFKRTVRLFLIPIVLWRLSRVFKQSRAKQILAMFPCEYYLFLSWLISRWYGVPLYSYFHNTYLENRGGVKKLFAKWLQPKVFRDSNVVFVMSEGMEKILSQSNPGIQFLPLVHTFDQLPTPLSKIPLVDSNFRLAFMGSLNSSNQDSFSRVTSVLTHFPKCSFTTYSENAASYFASLGIQGKSINHTRVAFDEVVDALRKHDLLFLPHGFHGGLNDIEYQTIFPTRTIPYLLSGIPIIAHSPPNAFLTQWLRKYDCAEVVDVPDKDALISCFENLIRNPSRCRELSENAWRAAQVFYGPEVIRNLKSRLSSCDAA